MELHKPRRRNGSDDMYCGPAALCAITGLPYEDVRECINVNVRGRRENQGIVRMYDYEVVKTLNHIGYDTKKLDYEFHKNPMTLNQYLKQRSQEEIDNVLLIFITGHFVTVKGDKFIDNHTTIPVNLAIAPNKRSKMKRVWIVRKN